MIYQGDTYTFALSLADASGNVGNVTTAPLITVFRASDNTPVVTAIAMVAVPGTTGLYVYRWAIPNGAISDDYIAIVTFATTLRAQTNQFLEKIRVGDSRVTDVVAKDITVAKDSTVAKDATVAHSADLVAINPSSNETIQQILARTSLIPNDPASLTSLGGLLSAITDVRDFALGTQAIDKTQSPAVMSMFRVGGQLLATFNLTEDASSASRTAR